MANTLLRPPRLRSREEEGERRATWLELFYDLIFVVAVGQLGHYLAEHVTWSGVGGFVLMFVPLWWTWIGTTFYASRFDTDDIVDRLATLAAIFAAVVMAANVSHALGDGAVGFALGYVAARLVLVVQYTVAGHFVPEARPLTDRFARGFVLGAAIWVISVFVPDPWRYGLWVVGVAVDIGTPLFAGQLHSKIAPSLKHLPERFGLFVLIVLGEGIAATVRASEGQDWGLSLVLAAASGLLVAFSLWWIYFEYTDGEPLKAALDRGKIGIYNLWLYTHLPLVIGLTAAGVGVEHVVASVGGKPLPAEDRWLLCGAVALCWLAIGVIQLIFNTLDPRLNSYRRLLYRSGSAVAALLLAAFGGGLAALPLLATLAAICVVQVVLDVLRAVADPHDDAALGDAEGASEV